MKVSIIVAVAEDNANLRECVAKCLGLDYPDFEIVVLPDYPIKGLDDLGVKCVPTGSVGPAEKRNEGMRLCDAALLAFIDDDAYPARNWLKNAVRHFNDEQTAAVGGPAVTAEHDGMRQKAGGLVYSSSLGGGAYRYRYMPQRQREVDDHPSCNIVVRRSVMEEAGGFQTSFWPGEDTALCMDITKRLGKKIIYDPEVLIYHHRRPLFLPHLRQVGSYALHRGYFVKRLPETSFRLTYFLPSALLAGLLAGGVLALAVPAVSIPYGVFAGTYAVMVLISSLNKDVRMMLLVAAGTVLTHLWYGACFIRGLASRTLSEDSAVGVAQ